jgi:hypothetical protein
VCGGADDAGILRTVAQTGLSIVVSPHLLRPFSSRQLSLVAGDGKVLVFAVLGGRYAGSSVQVHVPTLAHRVEAIPRHIDTVVFIDEPVPDGAVVAVIDDMVAEFAEREVDVLTRYVAASEAVKRVEGATVAEGIDRSRLVTVRPPEVIRRSAIDRAVHHVGNALWVNPTALVAAAGGSVALHGVPMAPRRAGGRR